MDKREAAWLAIEKEINSRGGDGAAIAEAYKNFYAFHDIRICSWLARLFDPDIGGFYYSNSGRDSEYVEWEGKRCYTKPDIESTYQAISFMKLTGIIKEYTDIPAWMIEKIKNFTCSLQDPEDGYIYHPQWGKNIHNARRGRDLSWSRGLSEIYNFKLPYPTALERLQANRNNTDESKKNELESVIPEHLRSKEAFVKYMEAMDWDAETGLGAYGAGNTLCSQGEMIRAAGLSDVMCDFLDSIQNKETGIWGKQLGYPAVNAFLKILTAYGSAKRAVPNAEKVAMASMDAITLPDRNNTVCYQFNAWWSVGIIRGNIKQHGGSEGEEIIKRIDAEMLRRAPECILTTIEKIKPFKCEDGSYSYFYDTTCPTSQAAIVAKMIKEGDINATHINCYGVMTRSLEALQLHTIAPKIFENGGYEEFMSALRTPSK